MTHPSRFSVITARSMSKRSSAGFSLIEAAIALLILGVLALAFAAFWRVQMQSKINFAERDLSQRAQGAIVAFAYAKARLPCPATDQATGIEDCASGEQAKFLPWATLQMPDNRARQIRYGVYRKANSNPRLDTDLATSVAMDRAAVLLTTNVSTTQIPIGASTLIGNKNLLDFCHALNTTNSAPFSSAHLHTVDSTGIQKNVAFAIALPGLGDADGDGNVFDGLQPLQTLAVPAFDAPSRATSATYDDKVVAMSAGTLFSSLACGLAFASIDHSHFNTASAAKIMLKGYYDYQVILDINAVIATVNAVGAAAGVAAAASGIAAAGATFISAAADAILTAGGTALAPVLAGIGLGIAVAGGVAAAINLAAAGIAVGVAAGFAFDFRCTETPRLETLAAGVELNARTGDLLGF